MTRIGDGHIYKGNCMAKGGVIDGKHRFDEQCDSQLEGCWIDDWMSASYVKGILRKVMVMA